MISGCGTVLPNKEVPKAKVQLRTLYSPDVGQTITAEVGQTLVSKSYIRNLARIRTFDPIILETANNGIDLLINIPPGEMVEDLADDSGVYFLSGGFRRTILGTNSIDYGGVVVGKNGIANAVYWNPDRKPHTFIVQTSKEIRFVKIDDEVVQHVDSFKRELIYVGVSKNVVSILYREFKNDMARPAFTQEIKYDLAEGNEIGYRGARFQVISATNTGIKYTLLKTLD